MCHYCTLSFSDFGDDRHLPIFFLHQLRVAWYNIMTALQDEQTQIKGAVEVFFAIGNTIRSSMQSKSFQSLPKVVEVMPLYWNSIHICFEDKVFARAVVPINIMQRMFNAAQRMRLRLHHGELTNKEKGKNIGFMFCFVAYVHSLFFRKKEKIDTNLSRQAV